MLFLKDKDLKTDESSDDPKTPIVTLMYPSKGSLLLMM